MASAIDWAKDREGSQVPLWGPSDHSDLLWVRRSEWAVAPIILQPKSTKRNQQKKKKEIRGVHRGLYKDNFLNNLVAGYSNLLFNPYMLVLNRNNPIMRFWKCDQHLLIAHNKATGDEAEKRRWFRTSWIRHPIHNVYLGQQQKRAGCFVLWPKSEEVSTISVYMLILQNLRVYWHASTHARANALTNRNSKPLRSTPSFLPHAPHL